jgi:general secretion pathway protein C
MAPRSSTAQAEVGQGLALIAVDGKPAKPYAVGARLDSDLVLQSVGLRTAAIGSAQGTRSVLLELPALATPVPGTGAPAPAGASTRMQSAIQATQAAQAAQPPSRLAGGKADKRTRRQGGLGQCAVPGTCPSPPSPRRCRKRR